MKTVLAIAMVVAILTGCFPGKELQVEMLDATLIRIDTIHRQTEHQKQLFTWRDQKNVEYTSFESMSKNYALGTTMTVLRKR